MRQVFDLSFLLFMKLKKNEFVIFAITLSRSLDLILLQQTLVDLTLLQQTLGDLTLLHRMHNTRLQSDRHSAIKRQAVVSVFVLARVVEIEDVASIIEPGASGIAANRLGVVGIAVPERAFQTL